VERKEIEMELPKVGDYMVFPNGFDNYPHVYLAHGATGTVVEVSEIDKGFWVQMDLEWSCYDEDMWLANEWPCRGVWVDWSNIEGQAPIVLIRGGQGRPGMDLPIPALLVMCAVALAVALVIARCVTGGFSS
jgi:hypothetical protein